MRKCNEGETYRSLREVHGLEDHAHGVGHLDDLAAHETQLLVVVEHRVHVLDPDGVDGSVEDDPLAIGRVLLRKGAEEARQHTVAPLVRHRIELTVQLAHRHRLRVDDLVADAVLLAHAALTHERERAAQHLEHLRLAAERIADEHEAVAHDHHLVHLRELLDEKVARLQVALRAYLAYVRVEEHVVGRGQRDARKQVGYDAVEERHVVCQELGQVDVEYAAQDEYVLALVRVLELEVAGGGQHRLDGAHAVVVVVLGRELLGAQLVDGDDLDREGARVHEAARVQRDLANERVVWHHHGHGAEEHLEIVGQLGAARVAGVHRYAHVAVGVEVELGALEYERVHFGLDGAHNAQYLLGHHREHLQVDAVELVEACPSACRRQTFEKLAAKTQYKFKIPFSPG